MEKRVIFIVLVSILLNLNIQAQTSYFVSPNGNDTSRGTQLHPFGSISRAVAEARKSSGNVVIYLTGGTYYLNQKRK